MRCFFDVEVPVGHEIQHDIGQPNGMIVESLACWGVGGPRFAAVLEKPTGRNGLCCPIIVYLHQITGERPVYANCRYTSALTC